MELCLAGLFFLIRDTENRPSCAALGVVMLVVTALTAIFHYTLRGTVHWPYQQQSAVQAVDIKAAPKPDEALTSTSPIPWVPRDELGVSAD